MIRELRDTDYQGIANVASKDLGYPCEASLVESKCKNLNPEREAVFVADLDGEIAGFVHVEKYDLIYMKSMANILGLAVSSDHQKEGLGKALLTRAEEWAKEHGITKMRLSSGGNRTEAHKFYRHVGYQDSKSQLKFVKDI